MNDNEIMKGLRCLAGEEIFCLECAYKDQGHRGFACKKNVSTDALDLIDHQKTEIENWKTQCFHACMNNGYLDLAHINAHFEGHKDPVGEPGALGPCGFATDCQHVHEAKTAAIKEFAERVTAIICENTCPSFDKDGKAVNIWKAKVGYDAIDNLVKEMVGEG